MTVTITNENGDRFDLDNAELSICDTLIPLEMMEFKDDEFDDLNHNFRRMFTTSFGGKCILLKSKKSLEMSLRVDANVQSAPRDY